MFLLKKLIKCMQNNSNDHKRMQSFDSVGTYTYGTSKDLVSEKEEIKCNNIMKRYNK